MYVIGITNIRKKGKMLPACFPNFCNCLKSTE